MAVVRVPADSVWKRWPVSQAEMIYERSCYSKISRQCETAWGCGCALVIVKGTPGIGKSFFLDYVLSKLLSAGHKVMVILGPDDRVHLYKNGYSGSFDDISMDDAKTRQRANEVDYVLLDPPENPFKSQELTMKSFCGKNVLITMSPDPDSCKKILKDAKQQQHLYIGPTSFEEAEDMRAQCYASDVSAEELQQRFDQAGGVPRLLMHTKPPLTPWMCDDSVERTICDQQNFALNDLAENPRRIDSGIVASQYKSLWGLYHLFPEDNFTTYQIGLCCENALKLLRERLQEMDVGKLWNLFKWTPENLGTLRRIRYEAYAHKKLLVQGITGTARKLTQTGVSPSVSMEITMPPGATKHRLENNNVGKLATKRGEVYHSGGGYMLPDLPNYPVIDSAFVSDKNVCYMFQMKAGKSKHFSEKAETIIAALGTAFVLITPDGQTVQKKLAGSPNEMNQFVLILRETPID